MKPTENMSVKKNYKNASSLSRMLKKEGFTQKEINELLADQIITTDELTFFQNFKLKAINYKTVVPTRQSYKKWLFCSSAFPTNDSSVPNNTPTTNKS